MKYPIGHVFYDTKEGRYYKVYDYDHETKIYSCDIILGYGVTFTENQIEGRLVNVEDEEK